MPDGTIRGKRHLPFVFHRAPVLAAGRAVAAFVIVLMFSAARFVNHPCGEELRCGGPLTGIPLGESLQYRITWLGIPVASGEIRVAEKTRLEGREVYHVIGKIDTNRVLSAIFPMHDVAESWIDAETLQAIRFEKNIDELRLKVRERMTFDAASRTGLFESLSSGTSHPFSLAPPPVHDVLSIFYWIRRQPLAPGETLTAEVTVDQKDWHLEVSVAGRETVKWEGMRVKTVRLEPATIVNGVVRRNRAKIYLSEDALRLPVRIVYKAPFGHVTGTLKPSSLKTPLEKPDH